MIKYDMRYIKKTTGHLWWKTYKWVWGLYEINTEPSLKYPKEVLLTTAPTVYELSVRLAKIKYGTEWHKHCKKDAR